jgi:hypothetical protein
MKKWLFNPFVYIAGAKSLLIGFVVLMATALFGHFSHTHFDGTLHITFTKAAPFYVSVIEQLLDWGITTIIFYILGISLSKSSIRIIDVAGTQALARWPLFFAAFIGFGYIARPINSPADIDSGLIFRGLISLPFVVWAVALMYNAFAVACNLKGVKAVLGFIVGVLLAAILSQMALHYFYEHIYL